MILLCILHDMQANQVRKVHNRLSAIVKSVKKYELQKGRQSFRKEMTVMSKLTHAHKINIQFYCIPQVTG